MKNDLKIPLEIIEIINSAVSKIIKQFEASDDCEYHLDGMKMTYIYGGFDLTFRIRHNKFGLSTDIAESKPLLMKSKIKTPKGKDY